MTVLDFQHKYVQGKNHGAPDKEGFLWDYKPDAGGLNFTLKNLNIVFGITLKNAWERLYWFGLHTT